MEQSKAYNTIIPTNRASSERQKAAGSVKCGHSVRQAFFGYFQIGDWLLFLPTNLNLQLAYLFPDEEEHKVIKGFLLDSTTLLIIARSSGLWYFDLQQRKFTKNYQHQEEVVHSLTSNALREIYKDHQDFLWMANTYTPGIDFAPLRDKSQFINPFENTLQTLPNVISIREDGQKNIWCATEQQGLYQFDAFGKFRKFYPYNNNIKYQPIEDTTP